MKGGELRVESWLRGDVQSQPKSDGTVRRKKYFALSLSPSLPPFPRSHHINVCFLTFVTYLLSQTETLPPLEIRNNWSQTQKESRCRLPTRNGLQKKTGNHAVIHFQGRHLLSSYSLLSQRRSSSSSSSSNRNRNRRWRTLLPGCSSHPSLRCTSWLFPFFCLYRFRLSFFSHRQIKGHLIPIFSFINLCPSTCFYILPITVSSFVSRLCSVHYSLFSIFLVCLNESVLFIQGAID